jgi:hypothetical protein
LIPRAEYDWLKEQGFFGQKKKIETRKKSPGKDFYV